MAKGKRKWRKWLIISAVSVAVLLGAGYIGLNMAVDYVLKSMVAGSDYDELLKQALGGDVGLDVLFGEDEADPASGTGAGDASASAGAPGSGSHSQGGQASGASGAGGETGGQASGSSGAGGASAGSGAVSGPNSGPTGAGNSAGGTEGTGGQAAGGSDAGSEASDTSEARFTYSVEVTKEKVEAVQKSVTLGEKLKLANVLMKRLSASDIDLFLSMLSGGMTVQEKRAARDIMLERLTPEEYNDLIQIAAKYGLSQGKSYEEVAKQQ